MFSTAWKASKKPSKQKKYAMNAPLHLKRNFVSAHLAKPLKDKYKMRSIPLRKGDSVKVLRGQFKKKIGKVNKVDLKNSIVYIEGVEIMKRDGSKSPYPVHPSNVIVENLDLADKLRKAKVERNLK